MFGRDDDAFEEEGEYGGLARGRGWRGRWEMRDEPRECFDDDMRMIGRASARVTRAPGVDPSRGVDAHGS